LSKFYTALDSLQQYKFADYDEGTLVVLGFGLLLQECWRVVELENDNEDSPHFLHESVLDMEGVRRVFKAIEEVISRLPQPDATEKRPKELESSGSAERQKADAQQKKPIARKGPTNAPPPVPSTSKQSGTQQDGNNPLKNVRSQQPRKPSKKLRNSK
jgi:hypothetical protein